jgi:hypothetical protein
MTDFLLRILLWRDAIGDGGLVEALRLPRCDTPGRIVLFLALLVVGALLIRWGYRRDVAWVAPRRKLGLAALRAAALAVVLFIATGALLDVVRRFEGVGTVMVLVDRSQSMALVDRREGEAAQQAAAIVGAATAATATRHDLLAAVFADAKRDPIRALEGRFKVEIYGFGEGSGLAPLPAAAAGGGPLSGAKAPDERGTQLGAALADSARRARGRRLDAVIVATDGGWNRGEDPVEVARSLGAPVIALGVGSPQARDLEIPFIFSENVVFKNDRFVLDVRIRQRGFAGRSVALVIRRSNEAGVEEVIKEEQLTLGEDSEFAHTVELVPDKEGVFTFTAELTAQPEEANTINNRKSRANIQVVDKKLRVLAIDDVPRWDFRFLRGIFEADRQRVQPTLILRQGGRNLDSKGVKFLHAMPSDAKAFKELDCIVLGDIGPDFFLSEDLKRIETWVRVDGGGLIVVAGRRAMPVQWVGTLLDQLLPVEPEVVLPLTVADELARTIKDADGVRPVVTNEGGRWAALRFASDPGENELKWRESEPLRWIHPVKRAKSGASVLLVHPSKRCGDDPMPILAVQRYGRGQVAWVGSDETWRWRFRPGVAQHRRLWGQLTSSLGMSHLLGNASRVQIESNATEYAVGDRAQLIARVLDSNFNPSLAESVTVTVERDLAKEHVVLAARRDQPGVFAGEWVPGATGRHRVTLDVGEGAGGTPEASAERIVSVVEPQLELDDGGMREDLLAQIAKAGDGTFIPLHRSAEIAEIMKARQRVGVQKREEITLWNAPGVLVLFVLLLGFEWWFRKRWDML